MASGEAADGLFICMRGLIIGRWPLAVGALAKAREQSVNVRG